MMYVSEAINQHALFTSSIGVLFPFEVLFFFSASS